MSTTHESPGPGGDDGGSGAATAPALTAATRRPARSPWTVLVATLAVLAVLAPLAWLLTRPAPDAGVPLAEALAPSATAEPSAEPSVTARPGDGSAAEASPGPPPDRSPGETAQERSPFGAVGVRDASLEALPTRDDHVPTRLRVPDLGIDAAVDAVGVEDDGSMVIPAEIARVGWYRFGPAVGAQEGNAVIAGHVDAEGEGPGALFDLRGVAVGTRVTVTDADGADHGYEIVSRQTLTKEALPVADIFARDGAHRLVIITCGGPFLPELSSYRDNVVVTAVPVEDA